MKWTLLLLGVFLVQEPISSNAVVLEAYQHDYSVWLIHSLFVIATVFDILVGYSIGKIVHDRYESTRLAKYIEKKMSAFSTMTGKVGERIAIVIYAPILFPLSPFLAPWLLIGFWDTLIFMFIGELLLWYLFLWIVVLGIKTFIPDPAIALYALLVVSFVIVAARQYRKKKTSA